MTNYKNFDKNMIYFDLNQRKYMEFALIDTIWITKCKKKNHIDSIWINKHYQDLIFIAFGGDSVIPVKSLIKNFTKNFKFFFFFLYSKQCSDFNLSLKFVFVITALNIIYFSHIYRIRKQCACIACKGGFLSHSSYTCLCTV